MTRRFIITAGLMAALLSGCYINGGLPVLFKPYAEIWSSHIAFAPERSDDSGGSGTLIAVTQRHGFILTARHVVRGMLKTLGKITIVQRRGDPLRHNAERDEIVVDGEVVKEDKDHDLALVRVPRISSAIRPIAAEMPEIGTPIWAIGNSGDLFGHLRSGIISSRTDAMKSGGFYVDAPISHGDSGGAIINAWGEIIGVSIAIQFIVFPVRSPIPIPLLAPSIRPGIGFAMGVEAIRAFLRGTEAAAAL